jgi:hypothetical protein
LIQAGDFTAGTGAVPEDEREDGHDLRHHLDFPERRRGNRDAAREGQAAQRGHGKIAPENHRHHPRGRQVHLHQRDKRRERE